MFPDLSLFPEGVHAIVTDLEHPAAVYQTVAALQAAVRTERGPVEVAHALQEDKMWTENLSDEKIQ